MSEWNDPYLQRLSSLARTHSSAPQMVSKAVKRMQARTRIPIICLRCPTFVASSTTGPSSPHSSASESSPRARTRPTPSRPRRASRPSIMVPNARVRVRARARGHTPVHPRHAPFPSPPPPPLGPGPDPGPSPFAALVPLARLHDRRLRAHGGLAGGGARARGGPTRGPQPRTRRRRAPRHRLSHHRQRATHEWCCMCAARGSCRWGLLEKNASHGAGGVIAELGSVAARLVGVRVRLVRMTGVVRTRAV